MIRKSDNLFELHTRHTTYAFWVLPTGQLEHLYYGRKINVNAEALTQKHAFAASNTVVLDQEHLHLTLEDERLEFSGYGKGDYREPYLELVHPDGSVTSDFRFASSEIRKGKEPMKTLPGSYGSEEAVEHLILFLKDHSYDTELRLHYYVFPECDVITRRAELISHEDGVLLVKRLLSMQLDFSDTDYVFTSFHGAHNRDMTEKVAREVGADKIVVSTYTGVSSNRANPFTMLSRKGTTEDHGSCYGFNLIYSGNHYTVCEGSAFYQTRVVSGINPQHFGFALQKEESFETPEAVMTYSCKGFNGMSRHMHKFVQNHIVRGEWAKKERPVLLNSWEATYFDINERKLLKLASEAAKMGMELFVMDDGWFGERDNDTRSLGDWTVNEKKLPNGIAGLAEKVKALGLDFGIWVEPEMVNSDSNLYRAHPDWALAVPGKDHSEGRNQRILDLCNPEVQDYVIEAMSKVFSERGVSYVKWDMNRLMSDVYSPYLPDEKQGEVFHRYVMGLYRIMDTLTKKFPHILFEGCASGGCRFDLGILCFFPQIWASDNTDALCRVRMMTNYSYGYPMSTVSAHVSTCPNHQTLRNTPLETRFNVAAFGVLGYECNLCDMKKEELEAITAQVALYKKWRKTMQFGAFYRGRNGNLHEWTVVSEDKTKAVGFLMHELMTPNFASHTYYAKGLDPQTLYHFYNRVLKHNIKAFGDLVNMVAPVHIKNESLMQDMVAKFVKMDGEKEEYHVSGDLLMEAGVALLQAFVTTGYNEFVRFFPDFASRIYFMEAEKNEK
ncbi:MAG: alpha-galactosidase [Lachnospiraceae bacterium]|nr:alpha-galactosidase [Lachnospiraceae bacterium]